MKKNIYLIIITIITVVCIIAGSLYHIGGFALGLFDNLIPRSDKSLGNVCTEELSVDEFSNLVFDTTISNINVKTGDSYMVSYKCNKRLVPKIKSSGDTLTISQSKGANYRRNTTSEITVTIPEGTALNKLSFDTGVGEVNLNSLTAADAEFDTGIGDYMSQTASSRHVMWMAEPAILALKTVPLTKWISTAVQVTSL